jgi:hypothetical protein
MELKVYYQKIRQVETSIAEPDVVVVSNETSDGGRAGVRTEVPRRLAAKMVVEGKARLATEEEAAEHREELREGARRAEELEAARKVQVAIVSDPAIRSARPSGRSPKQ